MRIHSKYISCEIFYLFLVCCVVSVWAEAHLCPLSIGLHHQHDTRVRLVERVSVQQSLAGHTQFHLGDAGGWTAEARCRGGGLLDVIHPGSGRDEQPTSRAVQRETSSCEAAAEEGTLQRRGVLTPGSFFQIGTEKKKQSVESRES